jgi:hypothetical protein
MSNVEPIVGTWKLNIAKSKFSQAAPKEQKNTAREVGDQLEITITGTQADGLPISLKSTFPRQGGAGKIQQSTFSNPDLVVLTKLDPGDLCVTELQNGKQVVIHHVVVNKDGKTARQTDRGMDPQGKPFEQVVIFDKQ